jgi:three-Cys-motif partner protein
MMRKVKQYSYLKYELLVHYDTTFSTGMKGRWKNRVYLDLYAGPGKSILEGNNRTVLGSPLIALSVPNPFDKYIFCESDAESMVALKERVKAGFPAANVDFVDGDCNDNVDEIIRKIPAPSAGTVLTFCFADPTDLGLTFETIRNLKAARYMDFLILLASEMDGRRNEHNYLKHGDKIAAFLNEERWQERWSVAEKQGEGFGTFLLRSFASQMVNLGYLPDCLDSMVRVYASGTKVDIYRLGFFSRDPLGFKLWNRARASADNPELPFD